MICKPRQSRFLCSVKGTRIGFFLWFLCSLQALLFGQEAMSPEPEQLDPDPALVSSEQEQTGDTGTAEVIPEETDTSKTIFYIRTIDFNITGQSRPFALMYQGEFEEGEQIEGKKSLEKYIKDKIQLLLNQRILESVEINYTLGDAEENGLIPVDILVSVVDTWNIIAIPQPKYDSNTGFELILKVRDYNFLGTMGPLKVDLGYERRDNDIEPVKNIFRFEIDSDTPFQLLGFRWNLNFDHLLDFTLSDDGDKNFSYKNITGLSVEFPLRGTTLTVGMEENAMLHEENPIQYKEEYGEYAGFYLSGELYASWKIPMGIMVYEFGELTYTPLVSGKFNYRPSGELEPWRKGPTASFSHSLGFGRIDWFGNYRNGLAAATQFAYTYNIYRKEWDNNYGFSVTWHKPFTAFFGLSSRFQFRQWFFDAYSDDPLFSYVEVGDVMRGILNNSLIARNFDYMLSLNLDFPFRVLRFVPSQWFKTRKLRFFDFDLHVSPFIDIALLQGCKVEWDNGIIHPTHNISFALKDMLYTGGIEFIAFPAFMRSLYVRASFSYNLNKLVETGQLPRWDELFIGIGHHY
jgi:hypothetical protein